MPIIRKLLIANRGEIAIRIARAAAELGIATVAVHAEDDAASLHVRRADQSIVLSGRGAAAYLDIPQLVQAAVDAGCDAVHPGYGFLSENVAFAQACIDAGLGFVGPSPAVLALFGDKVAARDLAMREQVPVLSGSIGPATLQQAADFLDRLGDGGAMMIKAIAGGGGRGMRVVRQRAELADAYARCQSEAQAAFGNPAVYVERYLAQARHVEIQIVGDGSQVVHLGERECSLQRRHQKLVEIAPSPSLSPRLRQRLDDAALRLASAVGYRGIGTVEFLVDAASPPDDAGIFFIETNPRLQVEHTVTEEVTGIDLVQTQLRLAGGASLEELGLRQEDIPAPRGHAMQLRINMESIVANGSVLPSGGTLTAFELPSGPGVRVDTFGYGGYTTSPHYDSLLAKLIVHARSGSFGDLVAKAYRVLCECRIEGVATNVAFLQNLLRQPDVAANRVSTGYLEAHLPALLAEQTHPRLHGQGDSVSIPVKDKALDFPAGLLCIAAPMQGTVVSIEVAEGDAVRAGQQIAVIEAMKMEHLVRADRAGIVRRIVAMPGATLAHGDAVVLLEPGMQDDNETVTESAIDLDGIRPDLEETLQRHAIGLDAQRPDAVAKRRKTSQRTARENIDDLCDAGSFIEYGALALAAQRRRRPLEELIHISPADGLVAGIGSINAGRFTDDKARCMVMSYDYTVFAGTQGMMNHKKTDRMFQVAAEQQLPVVLFAEGGGGRPGDTDAMLVAGLDVMSFINFAKLSGLVPRVGIVSGRCFAGNAALLGCCDVIIATQNATIGMGGPAMIEGGGLGVFQPEEVGPVSMQSPNGVIDIVVQDEAEAVRAAKQYLSYFQGGIADWQCADQRLLRHAIPENRLRSYDIRKLVETLADDGSVLELRREFGRGILTASTLR